MIKRVMVEVTRDDISYGRTMNSTRCPVALALLRTTGADRVMVRQHYAVIGTFHVVLPDAVVKFVSEFDFGLQVKPFSFEVPVPVCSTP